MINIFPHELARLSILSFGALQKPAELAALLEMLYTLKPRNILEIGAGNGGTSWAFSKLPSVEKLICIDLPEGPFGGLPKEKIAQTFQYIAQYSKAQITYIAGNSQSNECLEEVKKVLKDGLIDFLFIDGDHSYEGVKTDWLTYSNLVSDGGLIAFHDISHHPEETGCNVEKFWEEIKASGIPENQYSEFIEKEHGEWAGIGVVRW